MSRGGTKRRSAFPGGFLSHARYIFLAGFPGAGKTTALAALARHFQEQGRRVALFTNDLGGVLVDTVTLRAQGFAAEELAGGSLAARLGPMRQAMQRLEGTDIVLVEAVGSLADFAGTVLEPLRRELGENDALAPLSVLVDPRRAEEFFVTGEEALGPLGYLYRRQLEEAGLMVITQADRLESARLERLREKLAAEFPQAQVLAVSARDGRGLPEWQAGIERGASETPAAQDIDPDRYALAVAQLGWLDATIEFTLGRPMSGTALLQSVGRHLQAVLADLDLVHLKVALRAEESAEVGLLQLGPKDESPELVHLCHPPIEAAELIVNLRAETNPEKLHTAFRAAIVELTREFPGLVTEFAHLHYFRPMKPETRSSRA